MKLTLKLVLAISLGIVVLFSLEGVWRVYRQVKLFETDMMRDHVSMGRMLSASVAELWLAREDEGVDLGDLIEKVNRRHITVEIRWIPMDELESWEEEVSEELKGGQEVFKIRRHDDGERYLHTFVPVIPEDRPIGVLEFMESFYHQRSFVRVTIQRTVVTTLAMILLCSLIAFALGLVFVGRPVRSLVEKARRVGEGDFSGHLELGQRDEIGELAIEMNQMSDRLADAHERIQSETSARIAAMDQLRHADRLTTVGKLAAGIAHELGTPLNVVSGRAKMIASGDVTGPEAAQNARIIAEQSDRITSIIRQLLGFARRGEARKELTDLGRLTSQTLVLLKPMASKRNVTLEQEQDADPGRVMADAGQIQQVITNIVLNGIQAMPGGGTLRVRVGSARVKPPADHGGPEGEYACVEVSDEGQGIEEEVLSHMFDPFFTTKQVGEGTGLGLSVAYGIVRDHGGWIAVESEVGSGSSFTIFLPRSEE
jgi:signal transduction histidine kinase